jgi:hypothetical protein
MKISFNGSMKDFHQVLADWLAKDARWWKSNEPGDESHDVRWWNIEQLNEIMEGKGPEYLLKLLRLMVHDRHMFETMIAFAARYKSALDKATDKDVQMALDLIKVMEVQSR